MFSVAKVLSLVQSVALVNRIVGLKAISESGRSRVEGASEEVAAELSQPPRRCSRQGRTNQKKEKYRGGYFQNHGVNSSRKQKGGDQVERVLPYLTVKSKNFLYPSPIHAIRVGLGSLCGLFLSLGCSPPDLRDTETFEHAVRQAVPIEKLSRKRMYGMIMLFVDENDTPFTGWVKKEWENGLIKELGYLEDGQKQGIWMKWHANEVKESEIHWVNDLMHGPFVVWYKNGNLRVRGQTKDGEVDGEWTQFYLSGKLERRSQNRIGKLVSMKVWLPDGQLCPHSRVEKGDGTWNTYEANGTLKERRTFRAGIEIEKGEHP